MITVIIDTAQFRLFNVKGPAAAASQLTFDGYLLVIFFFFFFFNFDSDFNRHQTKNVLDGNIKDM